jgi:hypothetical protein
MISCLNPERRKQNAPVYGGHFKNHLRDNFEALNLLKAE